MLCRYMRFRTPQTTVNVDNIIINSIYILYCDVGAHLLQWHKVLEQTESGIACVLIRAVTIPVRLRKTVISST